MGNRRFSKCRNPVIRLHGARTIAAFFNYRKEIYEFPSQNDKFLTVPNASETLSIESPSPSPPPANLTFPVNERCTSPRNGERTSSPCTTEGAELRNFYPLVTPNCCSQKGIYTSSKAAASPKKAKQTTGQSQGKTGAVSPGQVRNLGRSNSLGNILSLDMADLITIKASTLQKRTSKKSAHGHRLERKRARVTSFSRPATPRVGRRPGTYCKAVKEGDVKTTAHSRLPVAMGRTSISCQDLSDKFVRRNSMTMAKGQETSSSLESVAMFNLAVEPPDFSDASVDVSPVFSLRKLSLQ